MKKSFRETKMIPVYDGAYAVPYFRRSYSYKRACGFLALSILIGISGMIPGLFMAMIFHFPPGGGSTGIIITTQLCCGIAALLHYAGKGDLHPVRKNVVVWNLEDENGVRIE